MSVAVVHDVSCDENDDRKNALALCSSLELSFSHDHDRIQLPVITANELNLDRKHSCASQSPTTHEARFLIAINRKLYWSILLWESFTWQRLITTGGAPARHSSKKRNKNQQRKTSTVAWWVPSKRGICQLASFHSRMFSAETHVKFEMWFFMPRRYQLNMPACTHMMFIEPALGSGLRFCGMSESFRESRERDKTNLGYFTLVEDFEELSEHTARAHHINFNRF